MKTAIIFQEIPEDLFFFVVDGDYRHLNGVLINSTDSDAAKQERLSELIYNENGKYQLPKHNIETFRKAIQDGAHLICCGFIL